MGKNSVQESLHRPETMNQLVDSRAFVNIIIIVEMIERVYTGDHHQCDYSSQSVPSHGSLPGNYQMI